MEAKKLTTSIAVYAHFVMSKWKGDSSWMGSEEFEHDKRQKDPEEREETTRATFR